MAIDITVPNAGESITQARVGKWLRKDGDFVKSGEVICELETEKANTEVLSPVSGTIRVSVAEGTMVAIGAVIGKIEEGSAPSAPAKNGPAPTPVAHQPAPPKQTATVTPAMSPSAKIMAEEKGIPASSITGTGRDGRIIKEDVVAASSKTSTAVATMSAVSAMAPAIRMNGNVVRETRQRMSMIRSRIAARLVESLQTTAQLTTFNEVDMSGVIAIRNKYKDKFKERHGIGLGFMSFFVKAVIEGLRVFPLVNARIDGDEIVQQHYYDIGVAVSTERGLMVPVIRDADKLSLADIEKQIALLAGKARDGKLTVSEMQGGTFTITNGGVFGSLMATPIVNPPQSGILGMHAIKERAVVIEGQIVARPMMYVALSYDHRIIDGKDSVQFLVRVKDCLEDPSRLMLEI